MKRFNVGDIVICVHTANPSLTEGERYEVVRSGPNYVTVVNNIGEEGDYFLERFTKFKVVCWLLNEV